MVSIGILMSIIFLILSTVAVSGQSVEIQTFVVGSDITVTCNADIAEVDNSFTQIKSMQLIFVRGDLLDEMALLQQRDGVSAAVIRTGRTYDDWSFSLPPLHELEEQLSGILSNRDSMTITATKLAADSSHSGIYKCVAVFVGESGTLTTSEKETNYTGVASDLQIEVETFALGTNLTITCNADTVGVNSSFTRIAYTLLLYTGGTPATQVVMALVQQRDGTADPVALTRKDFDDWSFQLPTIQDLEEQLGELRDNRDSMTIVAVKNVTDFSDSATYECLVGYIDNNNTLKTDAKNTSYIGFDFLSTPSCNDPSVDNRGNAFVPDFYLTVNCGIRNVYPVPRCEFLDSENGETTEDDPTPNADIAEYYDKQCRLTIAVSDLVPKEYTFRVFWYPDITNGQAYGKTATSFVIDLSPPTPTCEDPRFTGNNNYINVICNIASVFTQFTCSLERQLDGVGDFERTGLETQSELLGCFSDAPGACDSQCTMTVSVTLLEEGLNTFMMTMTKDDFTIESESSEGIDLRYPETSIVNCPNGANDYIKEGTTATCDCNLLESGSPPGRTQWVLSDNTEVGTVVNDFRSILSVTYDPGDQSAQLYYCQGATLLPPGNGPRVTFSPKFAYGPASITELNVPAIYTLCPPSEPMIITCNIDSTTVNPEPSVVIRVEGRNDLETVMSNSTGTYGYTLSFTPQTGREELTISCQASNSQFSELSATALKVITVQAPPTSAPVISIGNQSIITDGQFLDVNTSQSVQINCDVQGGVPEVSSVAITCGNRQNITSGIQTSLNITLDKTNNNEECVCTAEHVTGCYDNSTGFIFNVYFGPEHVQTILHTSLIKLCPSKREPIRMYCDVRFGTANPKPIVVVGSSGVAIQPLNEAVASGNYRFNFSFTPDHGSILTTTCVASNPIIPSITLLGVSRTVTVLEPPSSPPSMTVSGISIQNEGRFTVNSGQTVQVSCDVQGGFPSVTKVLLACAGTQNETEGTQLTQSITLNEDNNNDTCSCSAEHQSECYDLSTFFTFNVMYLPDQPQLTVHGARTVGNSTVVLSVEDALITLSCEVNSGNPVVLSVTLACGFLFDDAGNHMQQTVAGTYHVIHKRVSRDMNGQNCACIGDHVTGLMESSPLTFLVVSKPSDVTCGIKLHSNALMVSCEIGKVFPEALCQWSYLNEDDLYSNPVVDRQINGYHHELYADVSRFTYVKSNCSVTLTADITAIRVGIFTVKVTMNPDFQRIDTSVLRDSSITVHEIMKTGNYLDCFFHATMDLPVHESVQRLLQPVITTKG